MKPIANTLRTYWTKIRDRFLKWPYKSYAICVFVFAILATHTSAQGDDFLPLERADEAVWKIHNVRLGTEGENHSYGTSFAIGPNLFVTNGHVLTGYLREASLTKLVLSRPGCPVQLKIDRVLALSKIYDLALFETTGSLTGYLDVADNASHLSQLTGLSLIGYLGGTLQTAEQTGRVVHQDTWSYGIPFDLRDLRDLRGASGGPVVDAHGKVVGVQSGGTLNFGHVVKPNHIKSLALALTRSGQGTFFVDCTRFSRIDDCGDEAFRATYFSALEDNNVDAHFRLWLSYTGGPSKRRAWLESAADGGLVKAQYSLAYDLYREYKEGVSQGDRKHVHHLWERAYDLMEQAALKGYAPAQFEFGRILWKTKTTENRSKAKDWLGKASELGHSAAKRTLSRM